MAENKGNKLLAVIRHSPYGSSLARAALDTALAAAAFDQAIEILFCGDGVLHLLPDQDSAALGARNVGRLLASLPLYDIERVYVDAAAAARYQLDLAAAPLTAVPLDTAAMRLLLAEQDHLLGF